MNPTLITVLVLGVLLITVAIAFALYKAGFNVNKLKVKLGLVEVEANRGKSPPDKKAAPPTGPKIHQQANEGGVITGSGITAPADSATEIEQKARGAESEIDDSPIKLT